jgi:hypothetical protein
MVTENTALASALVTARAAWPQEKSTARLITKLAVIGAEGLEEEPTRALAARRTRLEASLGQFSFVGGLARLAQMRQDWD